MLTVVWASVALGLHGVVRPPRVVVRVAEADFVDHENLECGETCSLALKAFDASDNFPIRRRRRAAAHLYAGVRGARLLDRG